MISTLYREVVCTMVFWLHLCFMFLVVACNKICEYFCMFVILAPQSFSHHPKKWQKIMEHGEKARNSTRIHCYHRSCHSDYWCWFICVSWPLLCICSQKLMVLQKIASSLLDYLLLHRSLGRSSESVFIYAEKIAMHIMNCCMKLLAVLLQGIV